MNELSNEKPVRNNQPAVFAEIIIPLALPKNYTWQVPPHLLDRVVTGSRVEVNLGKSKKYAGIVKRLYRQKPAAFAPKCILNVLDAEPVVFEHQLALWEWMAEYYMCSEGEVMAAALPAHFKLSSETILLFNEEYGDEFSQLDNDEYIVAEALHIKKELKLKEVQQLLDSTHVYPVIKRLIEKKLCFVWEALVNTYAEKKETYILLHNTYSAEAKLEELMNNMGRAPKQLDLLLAYLHLAKTEGEVTRSGLLKKSGASDAHLKGLIEKNILVPEKRTVDRIRYMARDIKIDFELSERQQKALQEIQEQLQEKQVCLLHGVTASGKTQIYIRLIENYIRTGKQVLYLLPEITLTAQIIRRLQKHFGGYIGIYHSKFSQNERIEIWNKIKSGELKVILGARSALFLPFNELGLIIADEEHDASFKQQDPAPRYNARDSAIYYAGILGAKALLGSATPSVETYYNCVQNKYGRVELNERFGGVQLPVIEVVDTKKIPAVEKQKIIFSPQLKEAIRQSVDESRQVILFQNRRGYSPYQVCETCGWIPQCKQCDVSLTYHKLTNKLICHYCGTTYPQVNTCMACGNHQFVRRNFGTEKIEELLEEEFPKAKIARMDIDSVKGKQAHDTLIQQFEQRRVDILVGTQMVVKGLDFDNVNLVGILDGDSVLNFADFRVNERAFQLMEQVSGRAGRKDGRGNVMIQVSNTQHPVLHFVQQHDYAAFFNYEAEARQRYFYPPFSRIILLTFRHKRQEIVYAAAHWFATALSGLYEKYMVGPAEPVVNRIRNQYLMEILLKLPKDGTLIRNCKRFIHEQIALLHQQKDFKSVVVVPDVDTV
ncbi:MAG: primosomal protein N' [Chitinophagaceae bacterium]|nr:primosomal protein N' [Chitinophagaceae bacterium]MCW5929482.1 primosomal protein N' [Chitinophagaceae bacterium]